MEHIGINGITAEQIMRAAIEQKIGTYSYRELALHLAATKAEQSAMVAKV